MKYSAEEKFKMVKFFRYRKSTPHLAQQTYMTKKQIAKFLNVSIGQVDNICKKILLESAEQYNESLGLVEGDDGAEIVQEEDRAHFTEEQIRYLTSNVTLY